MLLSALQLLSKSLDLYRTHLTRYLSYSALLVTPTILLSIAGTSFGVLIVMTQNVFTGITIFIIFAIIMSLLGFIVSLALIRAIADDYTSKKSVPVMKTITQVLPMLIPAILVSIITSLAICAGIILLIIPGIIFVIWFTFSIHALILDDKHNIDALKYSKSLVSGRWFAVLWRLFAPLIVVSIVLSIIQWIFALILGIQTGSEFQFTVAQSIFLIINALISVIVTPLTVAIPTILYLELKNNPVLEPIVPQLLENRNTIAAE